MSMFSTYGSGQKTERKAETLAKLERMRKTFAQSTPRRWHGRRTQARSPPWPCSWPRTTPAS